MAEWDLSKQDQSLLYKYTNGSHYQKNTKVENLQCNSHYTVTKGGAQQKPNYERQVSEQVLPQTCLGLMLGLHLSCSLVQTQPQEQ